MQKIEIEKIKELTSLLNQWRHEYYNLANPTVTDAVYDRHYDELEQLEQETRFSLSNSPIQTVGYTVVDGLEKTAHTIPLLSLDKTKRMRDIMKFIGTHQVLLMHKLDGLTLKLEYENGVLIRASTRGDGDEGEVVTHNIRAIEGIPAIIPYKPRLVISGEAYIPKPTFERLRDTLLDGAGNPFKNGRNMASGAVRNYDSAACAERGVVFSPFSVIEGLDEDKQVSVSKFLKLMALRQFGFSTCEFFLQKVKSTPQEITDTIKELRIIADVEGLPIDGIVLTYNDIPYSRSLGRTNHHYRDGLAFKFEDDIHKTVLRDIEWTPSRSGEIAPVAVFDTIQIDGCDVSRASLHNLTFIRQLELRTGCRIFISKRNMIIPHIEDNLDRGDYDDNIIPRYCPCCGKPTRVDRSGAADTLHCDNTDCAMRRIRQFVHFVGKKAMDIEGLSEATLAKFISKGWLRDFMDIYRLNQYEDEIIDMEGFGEKSWHRLWDAIQRNRNTTFERFVVAVDISMIGRTASRELSRYFNGDLNEFEDAVNSGFNFTQLNDFGLTLHNNIHEWFRIDKNINLWKGLQDMINIQSNITGTATTDSPFAGRTIVVTGKLISFTRDTINTKITSLGAIAGSSVSKNTDYLIAGEKAGSKLSKARELGVTVLSEQEFLNMAEIA